MIRPTPLPESRAHPQGALLAAGARERACALVAMVRDESCDTIGPFLDRLDRQGLYALVVVLAAMVPDDVPVSELLEWIEPPLSLDQMRSAHAAWRAGDRRPEIETAARAYQRVAKQRQRRAAS